MASSAYSDNTRRIIADTLIELTKTIPYDKITVSFIAHKANVHRNTIYYHFPDLNSLIVWTIHRDLADAGHDAKEFLIDYFSRNDKFLRFAIRALGFDLFLSEMRSDLIPILEKHCQNAVNIDSQILIAQSFAEQILVAYLLKDRPAKIIRIIFDCVIPEMLRHDLS